MISKLTSVIFQKKKILKPNKIPLEMPFDYQNVEPGTLGFIKVFQEDNQTVIYSIIKNKILTFGRDKTCDISIQFTKYISKIHFRVWCTQFDGTFDPICYVQDVSLNGTYIFDSKTKKIQKIKNQIAIIQKGNFILLPHQIDFKSFDISIKYVAYVHKNKERASSYKALRLTNIPEKNGSWKFNGSVLGSGSFGVVFGCSQDDGKLACCKMIKKVIVFTKDSTIQELSNCSDFTEEYKLKNNNKNPFYLKNILKEKSILESLDHPNIVKFYESQLLLESQDHKFKNKFFYKFSNYLIFQELGAGGDLFSFLANPKTNNLDFLHEEESLIIIYQILLALKYLHSKSIAHRDLKLDNIILSTPEIRTKILLSDFGISKQEKLNRETAERFKTCVGTPEYTAPEVGNFHKDTVRDLIQKKLYDNCTFQNKRDSGYDLKCDIWSLGVLMFYLLTGNSLFNKEKKIDEYDDSKKITLDRLQEWIYKKIDDINNINQVSERGLSFLKKMLTIDAGARYDSDNCLKDKYIQEEIQLLEKIYHEQILANRFRALPLKPEDKSSLKRQLYSSMKVNNYKENIDCQTDGILANKRRKTIIEEHKI